MREFAERRGIHVLWVTDYRNAPNERAPILIYPLTALQSTVIFVRADIVRQLVDFLISRKMKVFRPPVAPTRIPRPAKTPCCPDEPEDDANPCSMSSEIASGPVEPLTIGIIDSGIDPVNPRVSAFKFKFLDFDRDGVPFECPPFDGDVNKHGTNVASVIANGVGKSNGSTFAVARVLQSNVRLDATRFYLGMQWLVEQCRADLINVSASTRYGTYTDDFREACQLAFAPRYPFLCLPAMMDRGKSAFRQLTRK